MKKILLTLLSIFILISCETKTTKPECAEKNWGTVTVHNNSQYFFYVNVYTGNGYPRGKRETTLLMSGESITWEKIKSGEIYYMMSLDGDYWSWERGDYVIVCDEKEFTWTDRIIHNNYQGRGYDFNKNKP